EAQLIRRRADGQEVTTELHRARWNRDAFVDLWNGIHHIDRARKGDLRAALPSSEWRVRHGDECKVLTAWQHITPRGFQLGCCQCGSWHGYDFRGSADDDTLEMRTY